MKLEKFQQLKVFEKIKFEVLLETHAPGEMASEERVDTVSRLFGGGLEVRSGYLVSPRQVICRIVKRKKPKLEFVGYGHFHPEVIPGDEYMKITKRRYKTDTHKVFVRPIVRKK